MEELLLAIAQFCLEIIFPVLLELFLNVLSVWSPFGGNVLDGFIFLILLGGILGGASTLVLPTLIGNHPIVQAAAVLFGPPVMGFIVAKWSQQRISRNKPIIRLATFWKIYWFAFPFLLVRSVMIHHSKIGLF